MKIYPCTVTLLTLALAGCGGGGGSSSSAPSTPAVSEAQKNYESMALSANGGLHYLDGSLSISTSSSGALTVNPGSFFFTYDSNIPLSAAGGPQLLSETYTTLASTLPLPKFSAAGRYLVNGTVYIAAGPTQGSVSYSGNNILTNFFAADGKTVIRSLLDSSVTPVGLSGLIASSPTELFTNSGLGIITNTINGLSLYNKQASWQPGSAYLKIVRQSVGDTLGVGDCVLPVTTGVNITPCTNTVSTLEGFFPHVSSTDGLTYQITDGQIVTLAGVRAWVSNAALKVATPEYRVYYQSNGAIYRGVLMRDGTQLQLSVSGTTTLQNFYIFLNGAAMQSVKSAVNF